ncbi:hypothetical protein SNEBB_003657 [Seison nebaliae]|nr:hypothetical protein SNEBB_003657 [Seison nebaliae]
MSDSSEKNPILWRKKKSATHTVKRINKINYIKRGNDLTMSDEHSTMNLEDSNMSPNLIQSPTSKFNPELDIVDLPSDEVKVIDEELGLGEIDFYVDNFVDRMKQENDRLYSHSITLRTLPWRLLFMPRASVKRHPTIGVFIEVKPPPSINIWYVVGKVTIVLVNHDDETMNVSKELHHNFSNKETDWGFQEFHPLEIVLDEKAGFLKNDGIHFRAHVAADAPFGCPWNSRDITGYVGIKNQGATCYMNSLLQSLFNINSLRQSIYRLPTHVEETEKSVIYAIQRLFFDLEHSTEAVDTKRLTSSFGWETMDSLLQHDVQELSRILMDKMEMKMRNTPEESVIPDLFRGELKSFVRCLNVDYISSKNECFYDIQLNVRLNNVAPMRNEDPKNIYDAFNEYCKLSMLTGDNKYFAGDEHGLQDAERGVKFVSFPPVLHLHLMRFTFDGETGAYVKINDKFVFLKQIDLSRYLVDPPSSNDLPIYRLQAVLVHSGDNFSGHYTAYMDPKLNDKWYKFDDEIVSRVSETKAIDQNYGSMEDVNCRVSTNAYMLIYIRESHISQIFKTNEIPKRLVEKIRRDEISETFKIKSEFDLNHRWKTLLVWTNDDFYGHQEHDLFNGKTHRNSKYIKYNDSESHEEIMERLRKLLSNYWSELRIWKIAMRNNDTKRLIEIATDLKSLKATEIFVEVANSSLIYKDVDMMIEEENVHEKKLVPLPEFDDNLQTLIFFKFYDPLMERLIYLGYLICLKSEPLKKIIPILLERSFIDLPQNDDDVMAFEEITPHTIEGRNVENPIEDSIRELTSGDIILLQFHPDKLNITNYFTFKKDIKEHFSDELLDNYPYPHMKSSDDIKMENFKSATKSIDHQNRLNSSTSSSSFVTAMTTPNNLRKMFVMDYFTEKPHYQDLLFYEYDNTKDLQFRIKFDTLRSFRELYKLISKAVKWPMEQLYIYKFKDGRFIILKNSLTVPYGDLILSPMVSFHFCKLGINVQESPINEAVRFQCLLFNGRGYNGSKEAKQLQQLQYPLIKPELLEMAIDKLPNSYAQIKKNNLYYFKNHRLEHDITEQIDNIFNFPKWYGTRHWRICVINTQQNFIRAVLKKGKAYEELFNFQVKSSLDYRVEEVPFDQLTVPSSSVLAQLSLHCAEDRSNLNFSILFKINKDDNWKSVKERIKILLCLDQAYFNRCKLYEIENGSKSLVKEDKQILLTKYKPIVEGLDSYELYEKSAFLRLEFPMQDTSRFDATTGGLHIYN